MKTVRLVLPQLDSFVLEVPKNFEFASIEMELGGLRPVAVFTGPDDGATKERMFSLTRSPFGVYFGEGVTPPPYTYLGSFEIFGVTMHLALFEGDVIPRGAWHKDTQ